VRLTEYSQNEMAQWVGFAIAITITIIIIVAIVLTFALLRDHSNQSAYPLNFICLLLIAKLLDVFDFIPSSRSPKISPRSSTSHQNSKVFIPTHYIVSSSCPIDILS
jgi:hypothetical protein